jgi:hypothetical protein
MTYTKEQYIEAREVSTKRFVTAGNNPRELTEGDHRAVELITDMVIELGAQIEIVVPDGRNKSISLTALEDVLTRANKAIYVQGALDSDA